MEVVWRCPVRMSRFNGAVVPNMPTPAKQLRSVSLRYNHTLAESLDLGRNPWLLHDVAERTDSQQFESSQTAPSLMRLEAALFLAQEPLTTRKLAKLAELADGTEAKTLLRKLSDIYDQRGTAFQITHLAGGYQLFTRPQFAQWLRLHAPDGPQQLSNPAMETLAIVAYRQPVLRADVEAIRGVQCGELLRQLMDRELLRIVGRSEDLGRPFYYGTTRRFLHVFGLRNLDELPKIVGRQDDELARPAA